MFCGLYACSTLARLGPEVLECQDLRSYTIAVRMLMLGCYYCRLLYMYSATGTTPTSSQYI